MNPREAKIAERLKELIKEGEGLRTQEISRQTRGGVISFIPDVASLKEWVVKSNNILNTAFGRDSIHFGHLVALGVPGSAREVERFTGVLRAALSDLEGGFLAHQEFLVAADIFDSVLEQAKELLDKGYKDPAAMLGRIVLENALRRLAKRNSIQDADLSKAGVLNDMLKAKQIYNQVQWRSNQQLLDVGNSAAHGKFDEYKQVDVERMLQDVARFVAGYLI
jgi:hypothetical protein